MLRPDWGIGGQPTFVVEGFRGFRERTEIPLGRLTILVGPNSGGKSSVLAALGVLQQQVEARGSDEDGSPLQLNGRVVEAGDFYDAIHGHNMDGTIALGFRWSFVGNPIELRYRFDRHGLVEYRYPCVYFESGWPWVEAGDVPPGGWWPQGAPDPAKLIYFDMVRDSVPGTPLHMTPIGPTPNHYTNIFTGLPTPTIKGPQRSVFEDDQGAVRPEFARPVAHPRDVFRVGPLRSRHDVFDLDWARWPLPDTELTKVNDLMSDLELNYILRREDSTRTVADSGAVRPSRPPTSHPVLEDLASGTIVTVDQTGVGISQLLPILIACARPEGTLLIEQPELHLHPRLQAGVGEVLARNVASFTIVETHSELLIRRVQTLIRRGDIDPNYVSIVYIDRDDDRGCVAIPLRLNDQGYFLDVWPEGFFEERLTEILQ